jgi:hypothetical protein
LPLPLNYQFDFTTTLPTTVFTYKFKIKLSLNGGQVFWAKIGGNEEFILDVICPTAITMTNHASLVSLVSYDIDGLTPKFPVHPFTLSNDGCPII